MGSRAPSWWPHDGSSPSRSIICYRISGYEHMVGLLSGIIPDTGVQSSERNIDLSDMARASTLAQLLVALV